MKSLNGRRAVMAALVILAATVADAVADVRWHASVDEAARVAVPANRPIMIDFVADWCAACKVMEKDVYETADFERAAEPFVLVRVDADHRTDLSLKYKIATLPSVLFTDSQGNELFRATGFIDLKPMMELLASLPHDVSEFNRLGATLARDRNNFAALREMGGRLQAASLYRTSIDYYSRALQLNDAKPDAAAREEILHAMGVSYLEVKEGKRAVDTFNRCLREFTSSPRRAEWTQKLTQAKGLPQR
jgi:thioredoxin-like negative regulator of GroEL